MMYDNYHNGHMIQIYNVSYSLKKKNPFENVNIF